MTLHLIEYVRIGLLVLPGFWFPAFAFLDPTVAARRHAVHTVARAEPSSVVIVADGSSGWQARTVNGMIQTFIAEFGSDVPAQVMRFDAEPGNAVQSIEPSLNLPPRTPMRDALIAVLSERQAPLASTRAVVLIVSKEFYGSSISRGRLVGTARQREVPIYSILLTPPSDRRRSSFIKFFGRALSEIAIWIGDALIEEEGSPSARDTSLLAEELANATDGRTYSATDYESGVSGAREIAGQIKRTR